MNYYEELRIRRDAPAEEVRQAYRLLVRLMHPDSQPDARLRAMAECQMRRLNEIVAILVDPQQRRRYNESLTGLPGVPVSRPPRVEFAVGPMSGSLIVRGALRHWFWILLAMTVLGMGVWYVIARDSSAADLPPSQLPKAVQPVDAAHANEPREAIQRLGRHRARSVVRGRSAFAVQTEDQGAPAEPDPPPPPTCPRRAEAIAQPTPLAATIAVGSAPEALKSGTASMLASASEPSFAGNWLYSPLLSDTVSPGIYPAVYVELVLVDERGHLTGDYRARYKIPDRAISPQVLFRVQGKSPKGKSVKLVWMSHDGAKGEVELLLRSPNLMNVTWWTTEFGPQTALSSGTALLIRQQAP